MPFSRLLTWLLSVSLMLLSAACAPGRDLPLLQQETGHAYRLGPGDTVRIITFGEESLTGEFRVSDSGAIAVPLLGSVPANNLTPNGLEAAIAGALKRAGMLRNPSVSAEVIAYRPIFVLGEVNKPGQYPYSPGMTVVTVAAVAGGFTYRAIDSYASVVRTNEGEPTEAKALRQSLVRPGDVITFYERRF